MEELASPSEGRSLAPTGTGDVEATEAAFRDSVRKLALLAEESAR